MTAPWTMGRIFRHPSFWGACFVAWFGWLCWLSSAPREFPEALRFDNSDKLIHFGFYFGGAGLLNAFLYLSEKKPRTWRRRILLATALMVLVGASDEFHQSFVPNRSGNDPFDLTADTLGSLAAAFVFRRLHGVLKPDAPALAQEST